jgi:GNAT superfamily N-acetyltransferase
VYRAVGRTAYAEDADTLTRAVAGSSFVVTARRDGTLVGVARAISDDATICCLQDILVVPDAQRTGIGGRLAREILHRYATVRQKVLLTDDEPGQRAFYESLG